MYQVQENIKNEDVYEYRRIPIMKKLKRYYRLTDLFANPVSLKYKGERYFQNIPIYYDNIGDSIQTLER